MESLKLIASILLIFIISCAKQSPPLNYNSTVADKNIEDELDIKLEDLANQIVNSMLEGGKSKIAVIEFSDLDGNVTEFGKFIAEELITKLFLTKKFNVIERNLLNKVMQEHKLKFTGLIDPNTAKNLGKILGVDAIASGSITDLDSKVRINARLISTETGSIFSVASVSIHKNKTVLSLMNKVTDYSDFTKPRKLDKKDYSTKIYNPGEIFFKESFQNYEEGDPVPSWGEDLVIRKGRDGRKYITSFIPGTHIAKQNIVFPDNFEFRYDWSSYDDRGSGTTAPYVRVLFELIDEKGKVMKIECGNWGARLPGLKIIDFDESRINHFKLIKQGTTYKIYNNESFLQSGTYKEYSRFVGFRITIPVRGDGNGQYFTNFIGKAL